MSKKYVRFKSASIPDAAYGILERDRIVGLTTAPWHGGTPTRESHSRESVKLLAPVEPTKVVCVGLNYHAHVAASQSADKAPEYPLIFLKPSSSIISPDESIVHPRESERVDYEAELGVVIGRTASHVSKETALEFVFGYTCANDVTARDLQKKDNQWTRAKGFDTFCPVGPWIETELSPADLLVEAVHNGQVTQTGRTSQMIFNIPFLVSWISGVMTLNPGDLICTGTPSGIQPMKPGDTIEVRIEGIGSLCNKMVAAEPRA